MVKRRVYCTYLGVYTESKFDFLGSNFDCFGKELRFIIDMIETLAYLFNIIMRKMLFFEDSGRQKFFNLCKRKVSTER
jgi:hypothetical protein